MGKITEKKKVDLLEAAVLSGNVEAVENVIKEYHPFEFSARAFGLACAYSKPEVVKLLAENGMTFRYTEEAAWKYKAGKTVDCYYYSAKYDLLLALTDNAFWCDYHFGTLPEITVEPNSTDERSEILEFLLQDPDLYGMDLSRLLYYAVLWRNKAVADILMNHTISLAGDQVNWLIESDRSWNRNELNAAVRTMSEEDFIYFLKTFGILLENTKQKIVLTQGMIEYEGPGGKQINNTLLSPNVLKTVLETAEVGKLKKADIMALLVWEENIPSLELVATAGWLKTTPQKEKLIQYATENQKTAALAWLLDFIAKTTDPVKEQTKEAAKMRRALNAAPSPAEELKKLWNYQKLADGTVEITGYKGREKEVHVPAVIGKAAVTAIGADAFSPFAPRVRNGYERHCIVTVIIPEGVKIIKSGAFLGCSGLHDIIIPVSMESMDLGRNSITIHAPAGSYAETYAKERGIPFVAE